MKRVLVLGAGLVSRPLVRDLAKTSGIEVTVADREEGKAREALAGDPANTYLSSHLVEARRRKLDLLRRATALTTDMD